MFLHRASIWTDAFNFVECHNLVVDLAFESYQGPVKSWKLVGLFQFETGDLVDVTS